ncbi:MAG TPA: hypothetical protein VF844_17240 [Ktedonobacteraceae bacterium]
MTLVVFPPRDGKPGLTEEADPTQIREGAMKMNVSWHIAEIVHTCLFLVKVVFWLTSHRNRWLT